MRIGKVGIARRGAVSGVPSPMRKAGRQRNADPPARRAGRGRIQRAASPGRSDMEVTRANETMIRAVVVFVGRAV